MRLFLFALPLILLGCNLIAPAYNADADQRVVDAYQKISELMAKAELGGLERKASYQTELNTYAAILSQLETAKLSIQGTGPTRDGAAAKANSLLINIIDGCLSNLKAFSQMHQQFGVQPNIGATQPVRSACDQTVKAVGARSRNGV